MIEAGKIGSNSPESSKTNPVATNITQMKTAELKAKLPRKITDFSMYMNEAKLTDKQQECFSLKMEYGITVSEIARRLRISRTVVDEHIAAAKRRIDQARGNQAQARKAAKYKQE